MGRAVLAVVLLALLLAPPPAARAADTIRFKSGRSLTGRIVKEDADTVTIELDGGGRLTVGRSEIAGIDRDAGGGDGEAEGSSLVRSEPFLVWNGKRRVGTRMLWVRKREGGGLTLEEESAFTDEKGEEDVRIRITETVTDTLEPVSFVYREISLGGQRLLEGAIRGDKLELALSAPGGKKERTLPAPEGLRFPLSAREFAVRERNRLKGAWETKVFDPREEDFFVYRFENAGTRRVDWEGAVAEVTVIARRRGERPPEEIWLDDAGRTLSEELNGPGLVAVRSTRERLDAVRAGEDLDPSAEEERVRPLFVSPENGFRIRKPALSWTFAPGEPGSRTVLTIENVHFFAYVDVIVLPETPEGNLLSSLALQMEKRFSSASNDFRKLEDGYLEVGGEKAYRMTASSRNRGEELRSWIVGLVHGGRTWFIAMACPKAYWEGAKPGFEAILDGFRFLD